MGFDDLKARLGLPANLEPARIAKTWVDDLIFTLNRPLVTGLLLTIAIICLYLDLHFMTGLLGIVAVVCFALFFWARFLGGTAGTLEIMLFLIGLACLALEIFVVPGTGVFGVSGGVLLVVSLVMASQTFGNIEPGRDLSEMTSTLKVVAATIVAVVMVASLLSRFLPRVPMFSEMILTPPGLTDADFTEAPRLKPEVTASPPVMLESPGVAVTALRPAGKARIDGKLYDVVSNGTYIPADTPIRVQSVQGNHIVVREA